MLLGLLEWGDKYLAGDDGPPVVLTHQDCGSPVHVAVVCADGHELDSARDVNPVPSAHLETVEGGLRA